MSKNKDNLVVFVCVVVGIGLVNRRKKKEKQIQQERPESLESHTHARTL